MDVSLYRIRPAREKAKSLDKGDTLISSTRTGSDGSYAFSKKVSKTGARYAVLFLVDTAAAKQGYYSSWARQPGSWESLVVPTNGDTLYYWGIDAAPGSSFRLDPGNAYALGNSRLRLGGRISGTLDCPGAASNTGHAVVEGASASVRGISGRFSVPSSGAVKPKFSVPAGNYYLSSSLKKCGYGKDPSDGYSANTLVKVKSAETTHVSVTKRPVKAIKNPKIVGKVKAGKTVRIRATWPAETRVKYWYYDGGGWKKFSPQKLRVPKRLKGKTLKIVVRSERSGHFAGVTRLQARVR
ncbi:hypothetical protein LEUCIP111803_00021 [Leucobacter soli]|uniref:Uncharacterized protein n=2 Tax=Leucobacter soli TaxID=2812850 RepID=A0A916JQY1_9MICO|nr:hypothetical protein LEUCIP111803_00021 [Leucobacter soli]